MSAAEGPIEIRVNGAVRAMRRGATVADLLAELGLAEDRVAVELDREIVGRDLRRERELRPGSIVEIVHFVGGG